MLQSYSPKRICLHEQSPVPWKQQKQDKSRTDTLQRLPRDCVGGRGGPSAVVAAALSMRLLLAPTPAVCGAICSHPGCFLWMAFLKPPARPVGHDQVSPALCPHWTCCLHCPTPPPGISYRATNSQDDTASVRRPIFHWSLAAAANEGCSQPHLRGAEWSQACRAQDVLGFQQNVAEWSLALSAYLPSCKLSQALQWFPPTAQMLLQADVKPSPVLLQELSKPRRVWHSVACLLRGNAGPGRRIQDSLLLSSSKFSV